MSIITISRGSYSHGKEVAEKVAQQLSYSCISREVLIKTSQEFDIPEIKLRRALHDAPSILDRFTYGKERYIAFVESTLLDYAQKDNMIYHGLAGHFIMKGIKHMLNVRIISDLEERLRFEMEQNKSSREAALKLIKKDDQERRNWSLKIFGVDTTDASLYDLVISIKKMTVDDAVDLILHTVKKDCFKTTPESQKAVDDMTITAKVKAKLVQSIPGATMTSEDGIVYVKARSDLAKNLTTSEEIRNVVMSVPGVKDVKIDLRWGGMVE
jgi:cytidylate kinase